MSSCYRVHDVNSRNASLDHGCGVISKGKRKVKKKNEDQTKIAKLNEYRNREKDGSLMKGKDKKNEKLEGNSARVKNLLVHRCSIVI